jgi:predicted AAA+ superfamily ATPase
LKRATLFTFSSADRFLISPNAATKAADEYYNLYNSISVPDKYKKIDYRDAILESYPFHPDLIAVLYERIATLDRFNRTRGALRLLTRVIRNIWQEKEADAFLIHPYHIDHSIPGVMEDLTKGIGDERMRNAIEADIWRSNGEATAQEFDEEVKAQWKAPLHRRTCNTIYLYSITPGRQGDHGIDADVLVTLMAFPEDQNTHSESAMVFSESCTL